MYNVCLYSFNITLRKHVYVGEGEKFLKDFLLMKRIYYFWYFVIIIFVLNENTNYILEERREMRKETR